MPGTRRGLYVATVALGFAATLPPACHRSDTDEPAPTPDPLAEVIATLEDASEAPVDIRFEDGVPAFVEMSVPVSDPQGDDPVAQVMEFLERFKDLYGFEDPAEQLVLDRVRRTSSDDPSGSGDHVFLTQREHGVPVYGASLAVHILDAHVVTTDGRYARDIPALGAPRLEASAAVQIALAAVASGAQHAVGRPALMFFDTNLLVDAPRSPSTTHLAWRVNVLDATGRTWRCAIDAHDGEVLLATPDEAEAVTIWSANNDPDEDAWDLWWFGLIGFDIITEFGNPDADGQDARDLAETVWDFYEGHHNRLGFDDFGNVNIVVHAPDPDTGGRYLNARSTGGTLYFGDGQLALDYLAHEWGHGISYYELPFDNDLPQSAALNEGFAHVSAMRVDDDDYTFGEDRAACTETPVPSGCGPTCGVAGARYCFDAPPVDHFDDYDPAGESHENAGVIVTTAYLLFEGGTHHGHDVGLIGRDKAGPLYYSVLVNGITGSATFRSVRDEMVARAKDWVGVKHGFTDYDVCQVKNAWAAVGIAENKADSDCDGNADSNENDDDDDLTLDSADNCPQVTNYSQADADGDGVGDYCDEDIDGDGEDNDTDACDYVPGNDPDDCTDDDGDTVANNPDNCPNDANYWQEDTDGDGRGDACDSDDDADSIPDDADNCPQAFNPLQENDDTDEHGNACDNCPTDYNPDQKDCDGDGYGAVCDPDSEPMFPGGGCSMPFYAQVQPFVHPLDLVSIDGCPGCGNWLPEDFEITLDLDIQSGDFAPPIVALVDEEGHVLDRTRGGGAQQLHLHPRASYYQRLQGAEAAPVHASRYFLTMLPGGVPLQLDVTMTHNLAAP